MKETGTIHWWYPNTSATNSSGFTGLPGDYRTSVFPTFTNMGNVGYWWSTTATNTTQAWSFLLNYSSGGLLTYNDNIKKRGISVRCVRD